MRPAIVILLLCSMSWARYLPGAMKLRHPIPNYIHKTKNWRNLNKQRNPPEQEVSSRQEHLNTLLQQIGHAENALKEEAAEIENLLKIVSVADQELENATNVVREISESLKEAQRDAATKALKSHSAHLQLSAHDQLLFITRQRMDALSAQAIVTQAELETWPAFLSPNRTTMTNNPTGQDPCREDQNSGVVCDAMEKFPPGYRNEIFPPQYFQYPPVVDKRNLASANP